MQVSCFLLPCLKFNIKIAFRHYTKWLIRVGQGKIFTDKDKINILQFAKPVTLTIWHVYGNQTNSPFNDTIEKFNASEGKAKGVIVKVASVSSSNVIDKALFASAKQEPGAVPLPDLFTAYPRVIPAMHDKLLHWDQYVTGWAGSSEALLPQPLLKIVPRQININAEKIYSETNFFLL